jgi:DNA mismatch repair protein MutS
MALMQTYYNLLDGYQLKYGTNTFLLMQVGSFFEVYSPTENGTNMMSFSQLCDLKIANKNDGYMAGFRDYMIEKYLSKINEAGYTSVVYIQEEVDGVIQRKESAVYSPGTTFLDDDVKLSNNVTCIWIHKTRKDIIFGLSNLDIFTGKINLYEYQQVYYHNPTTYDNIENFMSIYKPIELIFIYNVEDSLIDHILHYLKTSSKKITKISLINENHFKTQALKCENQVYQNELIRTFYPNTMNHLLDKTIAYQALCFLLNYVSQHNANLTQRLKEPHVDTQDVLVLANHSLKQLNILDGDYSGEYSSVLKLLNICKTRIGQREMERIILKPTRNIKILQDSYDMIEHTLIKNYSWSNLNQIKDIEKIIRKMFLARATPLDYYYLYDSCNIVKDIISGCDARVMGYVHAESTLREIERIQSSILMCLNLDVCKNIHSLQFDKYETHEMIVKGYNIELDTIIETTQDCQTKISDIVNYLNELYLSIDKKTKDAVKIHETSTLSFLITKKRKLALEKKINELPNKVITFSNFTFDLSKIKYKDNNNNIEIFSKEIVDIINKIDASKSAFFKKISEVYLTIHKSLSVLSYDSLIFSIQQLDTLNAKCELARKYNYSRPTIETRESSYVSIKGMRHPLIEHIEKNELYVTNDINIGDNDKGILLFGTNAVGKTSLIKAIGICVVMAQAGLYVPCKSMTYYPYEYIFTRIIGNDNIFKGLSTFGVEMSELRVILNNCNKNSLILGDELCSGTEIDSALSIFISGLETMYRNNSSFIFATHFHQIQHYDEIKQMDKIVLKHLKVQYNRETNSLVYDRKLADGAGESIYGLEVCKSLDMPEQFLERAYEIRNKDCVLNLNVSKYNKNKIKGICEFCKKTLGTEIHHLQYQKNANENDYIEHFHKNHTANLASICESCHDKIHSMGLVYEKKKTFDGYNLILR